MRLKLLSPGEMNVDQKQTYDEAIAGKRGKPPPPMMAWLNSPEMARHATRLGGFLRFDTIFSAKLSEIAILVTARHWGSHYEWYAHKRLALKVRIFQCATCGYTADRDRNAARVILAVAERGHTCVDDLASFLPRPRSEPEIPQL